MTFRHFRKILLSFFLFILVLIVECLAPLFAYIIYPFLPILSIVIIIFYMAMNTVAVWSAAADKTSL